MLSWRTYGKALGKIPLPWAIALVVEEMSALYLGRHERGDAPFWEWLTTRENLFTPDPTEAPPAWWTGPDAPPLAIPEAAVNGR